MIARLAGRLVEAGPSDVIVDVGGVGYRVHVSVPTFCALPSEGTVELLVHTHVREDAIELFGFASADERSAFKDLLTIAGVGPKLALAILSGLTPDELTRAVLDRDEARIRRVPGVGKKTAARIVLELYDKRSVGGGSVSTKRLGETARERLAAATTGGSVEADAIAALVHLGFPEKAAEGAVRHVVDSEGEPVEIEAILRSALRRLVP